MPNPNVNFGGSSLVVPGAFSIIDASQMVPASKGLGNVLAILGDSTGGTPAIPQYFRNGDDAKRVLRSGGLLDAIRMAFDPAANPDVPGADLIVAIRLNPATQSSLALLGASGTLITVTSRDYGVWTTGIQVKVEAGSTSGKKITVKYVDSTQGTITEVFDNQATGAAAVTAINAGSQFITAVLGGGTEPLANVVYTSLATGVDGTITSTQWTNALTALQVEDVDIVVPITQDQTIAAQVKSHVETMSGMNFRKERIAYVGSSPTFATNALYLADLTTNAAALASSRVALVAPGVRRPNAAGVTTLYGPEFMAAIIAGLTAGQQVGESPTYKFVKAVGLDFGFSQTDLTSLLIAGITPVQFVKDQGFRITQGITTWQADANPMFREISVRRVGDYLMKTIRARLEREFVGGRGDSQTLTAMGARCVSTLSEMVQDRVITAFQNVAISIQASVARVSFEFSPVEPINFIEITGYAKPGSLSANFTGQASFTGATP